MLLWSGQTVSQLGSQISLVAYPLLVLALTGSPAKAGVVGFARTVPIAVLSLPAGAIADRVNRKYLMVICDGSRALALMTIPIALAAGSVPYLLVVVVAVIDGAGFVVSYVAERGALRQLVSREQLAEAVARNESRTFGAMVAGPPLGGLLFGIGRALPFLIDAISYAASMTSMLLIRSDFQEARVAEQPRDVREGLRWIWQRPFIRGCAILFAGSNPVFTGLYLLVVVLAKRHGASSLLVGTMLAIAAAGGLLGALLAPTLQRKLAPRQVLLGESWLLALATAVAAAGSQPAPAWADRRRGRTDHAGYQFDRRQLPREPCAGPATGPCAGRGNPDLVLGRLARTAGRRRPAPGRRIDRHDPRPHRVGVAACRRRCRCAGVSSSSRVAWRSRPAPIRSAPEPSGSGGLDRLPDFLRTPALAA